MKNIIKITSLSFAFIFIVIGIIVIPSKDVDSYTRKVSIRLFLVGLVLIFFSLNLHKKLYYLKRFKPIIDNYKADKSESLEQQFQNATISNLNDKTFSDMDDFSPYRNDPPFPNSDFIKTIFLHMFEKHPYKEDDAFPKYFNYEYGIINMPRYFNEIKDEGLITLSPPEEILGLMKVSELKDILSERTLKKSGKKSELIERILSHIDADELPIINEHYFSLSPTGKKYIETHHDYIILKQHSEWGIGFWEYQNEKDKTNGTKSFNEIILSLLNTKILEMKKAKFGMSPFEYSELHNLYINAYQLFLDEECYIDALKALFKNVLLSLSGCKNNYLIGYKKDLKLKNQEVMLNYSPIKIDSYVAASICELREYYNENILSDVYKEFIGPYNLCTYEMLREVTALIFNSSILELSKYDKIIRDLFIKKLK
ncbi:hypothetical protein D3Z51_09035 [Clostridiaceae bacterium]|nr:hypothetical protein [Clostridiaceae bacterium]RKI14401.1 hypothetical protein D7V81_08520 [bacterium 1XD21-70]